MLKRRVLAALLACAFAGTSLAACGGGTSEGGSSMGDESSGNTVSSAEIVAADNEEPYEVVMEFMYYGNLRSDFELIEETLSEMALEKVNCTVSLVPVSMAEADTQMSLMISGGEKLDLMISMGATGFQNIVNRGQALALDDLLEQYGSGIKDALGVALDGGYINDTLYGIPSLDKFGREFGFIGIQEYMDKYELSTRDNPTYEELDEWFARVKAGEGDNFYPLIIADSTASTFEYFHRMDTLGSSVASGVILGENFSDEVPQVVNLFETEAYAQHCQWMHRWYEAGYINPDCITTSETTQDIVRAGRGAMFTSYVELDMLPSQQAMFADFDLDRIVMVDKTTTQDMLNAQNWVVSINSERPEKAFQFLNLLYEDADILNVLYYGIEGQHYEMTDRPGFIRLLDGADFTTATWGYNLGLYGAVAKTYKYDDPSYPDDYFDQLAEFDELNSEDGIVSPFLGYTFNSEQYKTEVAAVNDVITQYQPALEVGAVDPETVLPQFIEALKAAGIETIIEGNQADLDAWLAQQ